MKLYVLDKGWRGSYSVIAKSADAAVRKMKAFDLEQKKDNRYHEIDESDITVEDLEELSVGMVWHSQGDA